MVKLHAKWPQLTECLARSKKHSILQSLIPCLLGLNNDQCYKDQDPYKESGTSIVLYTDGCLKIIDLFCGFPFKTVQKGLVTFETYDRPPFNETWPSPPEVCSLSVAAPASLDVQHLGQPPPKAECPATGTRGPLKRARRGKLLSLSPR